MSYVINPGSIRHSILSALAKGDLTLGELSVVLEGQKRQFSEATLNGVHLPQLCGYGLLSIVDGVICLTAEGHAKARQLDFALIGGNRADLTPPRNYTGDGTGDPYDGAELRRNPGIPAERYAAFDLPSIQLGHRVWPDGRREKLDDSGR